MEVVELHACKLNFCVHDFLALGKFGIIVYKGYTRVNVQNLVVTCTTTHNITHLVCGLILEK